VSTHKMHSARDDSMKSCHSAGQTIKSKPLNNKYPFKLQNVTKHYSIHYDNTLLQQPALCSIYESASKNMLQSSICRITTHQATTIGSVEIVCINY